MQESIRNELNLGDVDFNVKRDANGRPGDAVKILRSSTIASLKLKSGDVLYITPVEGTRFTVGDDDTAAAAAAAASTALVVAEDEVDKFLAKQSGRIERPKTAQCQHNATTQKCLYCAPLGNVTRVL